MLSLFLCVSVAGAVAGGSISNGFIKAAADVAKSMYPETRLRNLSTSSPLLAMKDMNISKVSWRRVTRMRMGGIQDPELKAVLVNGRPAVIVSQHDITGGLIGTRACSVGGYSAGTLTHMGSAFKIMRNITLFAGK